MTHMPGRIMPESVEWATQAWKLTTELVETKMEFVKAKEQKKQMVETTCKVT